MDRAGSVNPNIGVNFGSDYLRSSLSFDFKELTGTLSFRVDVVNTAGGAKNLDLLLTGTFIALRDPSGGTLVSATLGSAGYVQGDWNNILMQLDETAGTASVFVNGNNAIDYTNAGINWQAGLLRFNMGFSTANGVSGNLDNVRFYDHHVVPEPRSGGLFAIGILLVALRLRAATRK